MKRDMTVLIVVGAPGSEEYRKHFTEEAALLHGVCAEAGVTSEVIGSQAEDAARTDAAVLQASIAACHARARTADETNWVRIAAFYAVLANVAPSPVVELNQAMAIAMASSPGAGSIRRGRGRLGFLRGDGARGPLRFRRIAAEAVL